MKRNALRDGGKRGTLLVSGTLLCGAVSPLQAGEFSYGLGYVATYSDNITRVPTNERSDWIHSLLAGCAYQENTTELVARVLAQAEYNHYQKHTYDDEPRYYLDSSAVWTISPQRFFWTLEDAARQALINSTAVDTPPNRTNVNVLSTGPGVVVRFSPVHSLALDARASDVYTGQANADNKRFNGSAGWLYQASSVATFSMNYQTLTVRYDDSTLNNDFMRQDLFARVQYRPSRSEYVLDLGVTDLNRDRGDDLSGNLARLWWNRQLSPESTFGISASTELSDTSRDILEESQILTAPTVAPEQAATIAAQSLYVITSDVYHAKQGVIFYTRRSSQLGLRFQAIQRKFDYETIVTESRKETGGRLQIDYFYSGAATATLFTTYTTTDYLNFVRRDIDRYSGIHFGYRLTRSISLGLEGSRTDRTSTDPTAYYVDNRVLFSVLYSSGPLFTPVHGR
jgi:hypothetical protein